MGGKLIDRFWQNLRRGARVRRAVFHRDRTPETPRPHLHTAVRGAIPRAILRRVVQASYFHLSWPRFDQAVYVGRLPVWDSTELLRP
jgi:hypothetical protein